MRAFRVGCLNCFKHSCRKKAEFWNAVSRIRVWGLKRNTLSEISGPSMMFQEAEGPQDAGDSTHLAVRATSGFLGFKTCCLPLSALNNIDRNPQPGVDGLLQSEVHEGFSSASPDVINTDNIKNLFDLRPNLIPRQTLTPSSDALRHIPLYCMWPYYITGWDFPSSLPTRATSSCSSSEVHSPIFPGAIYTHPNFNPPQVRF